MNVIINIVLLVQILSALAVIGLILIQHGKGADMGAAFGSGSSGSLFGASGGANFLSRTTAVLAAIFFSATLGLAYLGQARPAKSGSVLEGVAVPIKSAPANSDVSNQIPGATTKTEAASAKTAPPSPSAASSPTPAAGPAEGGASKIPSK